MRRVVEIPDKMLQFDDAEATGVLLQVRREAATGFPGGDTKWLSAYGHKRAGDAPGTMFVVLVGGKVVETIGPLEKGMGTDAAATTKDQD